MVVLPIAYTHPMAECFDDPEYVQPDGFLAPRAVDRRTPHTWVGLGGGPHTCLGMGVDIGRIQLKAVFLRPLSQVALKLIPEQDNSSV